MNKRIFILLSLFVLFLEAFAQKTDKKLKNGLEGLIKGFQGEIGIYGKNLKNGKTVAINEDGLFPTASIVKIPILIGIMDKISRGELNYHQDLRYRDSLFYAGVDLLGSFKDT